MAGGREAGVSVRRTRCWAVAAGLQDVGEGAGARPEGRASRAALEGGQRPVGDHGGCVAVVLREHVSPPRDTSARAGAPAPHGWAEARGAAEWPPVSRTAPPKRRIFQSAEVGGPGSGQRSPSQTSRPGRSLQIQPKARLFGEAACRSLRVRVRGGPQRRPPRPVVVWRRGVSQARPGHCGRLEQDTYRLTDGGTASRAQARVGAALPHRRETHGATFVPLFLWKPGDSTSGWEFGSGDRGAL